MLTFVLAILITVPLDAGLAILCLPGKFPTPEIRCAGTEEYSLNGNNGTRYFLEVENWEEYPPELFDPAPHLPPCGLNTEASRTFVHIKDGLGNYLKRFCSLSSPESLQNLWFSVAEGDAPPASVVVELEERQCEVTASSDPLWVSSCFVPPRYTNRAVEEVRLEPGQKRMETQMLIVFVLAASAPYQEEPDALNMSTEFEVSVNGRLIDIIRHEASYTPSVLGPCVFDKGRAEGACAGGECSGWTGDGEAYCAPLNIGTEDHPDFICACKKDFTLPDIPLGVELNDGDVVRVVAIAPRGAYDDEVNEHDNALEFVYHEPTPPEPPRYNRSIESVEIVEHHESTKVRIRWATSAVAFEEEKALNMNTDIVVAVNGEQVGGFRQETSYSPSVLGPCDFDGKSEGEGLCGGGHCDGWSGEGEAYCAPLNIGTEGHPDFICACKQEIGLPDLTLEVDLNDGDVVRVLLVPARGGVEDEVATDDNEFETTYSAPEPVFKPLFRRGDADVDTSITVSDAIVIFAYLFLGGAAPSCQDAADADDNGILELNDGVSILWFSFLGGAPPPAPGPAVCGPDPTEDGLPACVYGPCLIAF